MTETTGLQTTYNNTTMQPRNVMNRILMQDPYDIPLFTALGLVKDGFDVNTKGTKIEWPEKAYAGVSDTSDDGLTSGTTTTTFTPDTPALYQPGMVIQIDSEMMWISAVAAALTITRGYGGTTAATHVDDSVISIVGIARLEGDDADDSPNLVLSMPYNYTQIMQHTIKLTGTAEQQAYYAKYDPWDSEIDGAMESLMLLLEKLPFYGKRLAGSATTPRGAGGFGTFITTNATALSSAALTRKHVEDMLEDVYGNGGDPDLIVANSWGKRKLNAIYGDDKFDHEADNRFEGYRTDWLENPIAGRPLQVVVSRDCPAGYMYFLTREQMGFVPYRDFSFKELGLTGDSKKGEVVGEWSFMVGVNKHHGVLTGMSTTK